jgi:hypothetical protein
LLTHATFSLCSLSLQALIAYLLTALSVLGVSKKYCQKGADALLKSRAKKNDTRVPHDVLRREAVLDEHAITRRNGGRRISTVLQLDGDLSNSSDGGNDGDIELSIVGTGGGVVHRNPMRRTPAANISIVELNQIKEELRELKDKSREMESMKKTIALLMKHVSFTHDIEIKDTTSTAIKDTAPSKKHRNNPHWNKLKTSMKAANTFKASSSSGRKNVQKNRTKRLSKVMKSRRNSAALEQEQHKVMSGDDDTTTTTTTTTPVERTGAAGVPNEIQTILDEATGRRYSYNNTTGESSWLDEE